MLLRYFAQSKLLPIALLGVMLGLQGITLILFPSTPKDADSNEYWGLSTSLMQSGEFAYAGENPSRVRQPMYPLFLTAMRWLFGDNVLIIKIAQMIIVTAAVCLFYLYARRAWDKEVAQVALVLIALYFPFHLIASRLLSEAVFFPFLVASFFLVVHAVRTRNGWLAMASGFALALTTLSRPITLGLPLVFIATIGLATKDIQSLGKRLTLCLLLLTVYLVTIMPWGIRNYITMGEFDFSNSGSGWALWLTTLPSASFWTLEVTNRDPPNYWG